jgi:hypothetical protein
MQTHSIQLRCFMRVIFYVLILSFVESQLDIDQWLNPRHEPADVMNQIPAEAQDSENMGNDWNDQDRANESGIVIHVHKKIPGKNSLIIFFYMDLNHPVFSPPPKTLHA